MQLNSALQGQAMGLRNVYAQPESLQVRLERTKAELETQLRKVDVALGLLKKNPDLQDALNAISEINSLF